MDNFSRVFFLPSKKMSGKNPTDHDHKIGVYQLGECFTRYKSITIKAYNNLLIYFSHLGWIKGLKWVKYMHCAF